MGPTGHRRPPEECPLPVNGRGRGRGRGGAPGVVPSMPHLPGVDYLESRRLERRYVAGGHGEAVSGRDVIVWRGEALV